MYIAACIVVLLAPIKEVGIVRPRHVILSVILFSGVVGVPCDGGIATGVVGF